MKQVTTDGLMSRALIAPGTFNKDARMFDVVFATETPYLRSGWEENYNEILLCDEESVRMGRAAEGLPVFDNHPWDKSTQNQLGRCSDIRFENKQLVGTVTLGARADDALISDIENGIVKGVSVGYSVYKYVREPTLNGEIPNYTAIDWEPCEVSFAPIPADTNSKIRSSEHIIILTREEMDKPEGVVTPKAPEGAQTTQVDVDQVRKEASKDEKKRLENILLSTRAAKLEDSKAIEFFNSEKTIEEIRQAVIDEFVAKDPKVQTVKIEKEAIDKKRSAVEASILSRLAPSQFPDKDNLGNEYRGMTLLEIGKDLLIERGVNVRGLSKMEIVDKVFQRDMSTSDFPLLLENVANKMLRGDYPYSPEYWNMISRQTSVNDFKEKSMYQIGKTNGMKETIEGEEIKYSALLESKQKIKVKSYAEGLRFTRQAMINDDLSAFSRIPSAFVMDWNTTRGDLVWSMLTDNVTMDDNKALFHTDHKNLAGTKGVIADTTLAAAILAMKIQKGLDGKTPIRVIPKFIIVSPEYEIAARKLITSITPTAVTDVNVFSTMSLNVIVENRLSGKAWYLAADPNITEGLYHAYLDGQEGLRSSRVENFNTDSIDFAVRGEFGTAAIDFRGLYKNAGE